MNIFLNFQEGFFTVIGVDFKNVNLPLRQNAPEKKDISK
jgi:hypothetical protein